jgi:uncharacterized Zn finger protein (UPF0148 family)
MEKETKQFRPCKCFICKTEWIYKGSKRPRCPHCGSLQVSFIPELTRNKLQEKEEKKMAEKKVEPDEKKQDIPDDSGEDYDSIDEDWWGKKKK